jgi:ABC-type transport system, involved in lipoprotein release, permease component
MISVILSVISILVAAIVIFVIIYVNALNKRRQIGILKAIGIKQSIIINAYIMQSLFYTFFGVIIGLALVFCITVPFLKAHPLVLVANLANLTLYYTPVKIAVAISSFFVAGYLAGRIPAWMVAKQDIIKAIWG